MPLHQTSITGIIIALGLLIDNGIIVVEDYKHRRSSGLEPREAINKTIHQLVVPLLAATFTTVFAFLPIATGEGSSTEFVGGMAVTVILAITSSLFLALTIVPVMMAYLEKVTFFNKISSTREGKSFFTRTLLLVAFKKSFFDMALVKAFLLALIQMPRPGSFSAISGNISLFGSATKRIISDL